MTPEPMPLGLTPSQMTWIGAATAVLGFVAPNLPVDTPDWVRLIIGALLAGAAYFGGLSHAGVGAKKDTGKP